MRGPPQYKSSSTVLFSPGVGALDVEGMNERTLDQCGPALLEPTRWEIRVTGEEVDLRMLAEVLEGPDISLTVRDSEYFLTSDALTNLADPHAVREKAREVLGSMAALAMLYVGATKPIAVDQVFRVDGDGTRTLFLMPDPAIVSLRALPPTLVISDPDGKIVRRDRPADPVAAALRKALQDEVVGMVLRMRKTPGWFELYKILEAISKDVGNVGPIAASEAEMKRFKRTANSMQALGDAARHGRKDKQPPPNPMPLDEARAFIDRIIKSWLKTK